MLYFKLFYRLLLTTAGLFVIQPLFSQAQQNTQYTTTAAEKDNNQLRKVISIIPGFPATIHSKLNRDSSMSLEGYIRKNLPELYIRSGEVYFSGAGFPYVERILFLPNGSGEQSGRRISDALKELLRRCRPGSEITFVQCSFSSTGGAIIAPINRTVRIQ